MNPSRARSSSDRMEEALDRPVVGRLEKRQSESDIHLTFLGRYADENQRPPHGGACDALVQGEELDRQPQLPPPWGARPMLPRKPPPTPLTNSWHNSAEDRPAGNTTEQQVANQQVVRDGSALDQCIAKWSQLAEDVNANAKTADGATAHGQTAAIRACGNPRAVRAKTKTKKMRVIITKTKSGRSAKAVIYQINTADSANALDKGYVTVYADRPQRLYRIKPASGSKRCRHIAWGKTYEAQHSQWKESWI